jgi:cation diffusion facilitator CzcD-associated flavoprotein CzcO
MPYFKGQDVFPGRILHSHDYKVPSDFAGERVLLVGAGISGEDIARDLSAQVDWGCLVARR